MSPGKLTQLICLAAAAAALAGAVMFQVPIDQAREAMDRTSGEELTGVFPELRLLKAMPGGMRALMIDYLWIRSEQLKREGKIFDAIQLSRLICKLQPRLPGVWGNRAWNLAYNISVTEDDPARRWHWVSAGVKLLRDEGLRYNPKALDLYRELSWIYFHKMGGLSDTMQRYYKRYHAAEFHRVLGAPPFGGGWERAPDGTRTRVSWREKYTRWLKPIVEAADDEEALLADARVADFVEQLADSGVELDIGLLDAYNRWSHDAKVKIVGRPVAEPATEPQRERQRLMTDAELEKPRAAVVAFVRRRVLRDTYNMRPAWMLEMAEKYGPLDWRLVWAHSLYWSTFGVHHCLGVDLKSVNYLNTDRNILNSLKLLTANGRIMLSYEPGLPRITTLPDPRFVRACHNEHLARGERITGEKSSKTHKAFQTGHINFLMEAIVALWQDGQDEEARAFFEYVPKTYSLDDPIWQLSLEQFVTQMINQDGTPRQEVTRQLVYGLMRAYFLQLAAEDADDPALDTGEDDERQKKMDRAEYLWRAYQNNISRGREEMDLPPFKDMQADIVKLVLLRNTLAFGEVLWPKLPTDIQQRCYDHLALLLRPVCKKEEKSFDALFPEPLGMEAYRAKRARSDGGGAGEGPGL